MSTLRKTLTSKRISVAAPQPILGKSVTLDTVFVLRLVAKGWPYLRELEMGKSYVSELASRIGKAAPEASIILDELEGAGLVAKQKQQGATKIDCALTSRGRAWVKFIREQETKLPLRGSQVVDSEEVNFLLSIVRSPPNGQSLEEAENLLLKTISTHRVSHTDAEALISAAEKQISANQRGVWSRWLSIIQGISRNTDDKTTLQLLQQNILPHVIHLLDRPELQGPTRKVAAEVARDLLGEKKWLATLRKQVETKVLLQMPAEKEWSMVEDSLIDSLGEMYAADRVGVLRWMFGLMQSKDESVRQRAQQLIQRLKG